METNNPGRSRPDDTTSTTERPLDARDLEILSMLCFSRMREMPESSQFWADLGQRCLNTSSVYRTCGSLGASLPTIGTNHWEQTLARLGLPEGGRA